jgi:ribonuclease T2
MIMSDVRGRLAWFAAAVALTITCLLPIPGEAQRAPYGERPPYNIPQSSGPGRSGAAGQFDYYALVLSWSPTYCAGLVRNDYDPQCHRRDGRRYAFVLHGLWPQYERGYPEHCPTRERVFVPQSTIDRMQDIMPSPRLTIYEYRKHGTCSGLEPDGYYDLSRRLYAKVRIPQRYQNPQAPFFVAPGELIQELTAANPGLRPDMLAVVCGGPGNRMREVRVCFSREGEYRVCGPNESQRRLCAADRMYVPPVRLGPAPDGAGGRSSPGPLPGPLPGPGERRL